jgi:uncharacterized repeat protein (TIGR01451 family)
MCIYYGDLHSHTGYSDGEGTPQQAYQMARANGLDFFTVTDHAELLKRAEWDDTLVQAQAATVEGQFVALRGFEWTSKRGHINVLGTGSRVKATDPRYDGLNEFYAWLSDPAQINSVAQFDHPDYPPQAFKSWRYDSLADLHINLIETHNSDFSYLHEYTRALTAGWHVAAASNSDTHEANWGKRRGRTGIVAPGLTYYHVLNALRARRTFSTEDNDLTLAMRADGYWMGSVLRSGPIHFDVYAFDPDPSDPIATLELYRNGVLFQDIVANSNVFTWSFSLPALHQPGTWWYVKAIQSDGEAAYTSSLWTQQPKQYDVSIRDNMWDVGDAPSLNPAWQSPDIWIRNQADDQMWHENLIAGETNYVHARVRNIGSDLLTNVDVHFYWADPALGFVWPESWRPIQAAPTRIQSLAPGEATIVRVPWDVPDAAPEHVSLLVRLVSDQDPIQYEGHPRWDNNIGWKSVHIVEIDGSEPVSATLYLANPFNEAKTADVHISSDEFPAQGYLALHLEADLFDRWMATDTGGSVKGAVVNTTTQVITISLPAASRAVVYGLPLEAGEAAATTLVLGAPFTTTLAVRVSQQIDGEETGGNLYTTSSSNVPRKIDLEATAGSVAVERSAKLVAAVVGEGFVPVVDDAEVTFSTSLGDLSADVAQTTNGLVTATLNAGVISGTAVLQAGADGLATATTIVHIYHPCWARLNDDPTEYPTIQAAVDASTHPTDVVKIAGRCITTNGLAQMVYISKTVTVRGGYTVTNWTMPDPAAHPTTLDAQGQGRVFFIAGAGISPTIEGLVITGGHADGPGGGMYVVSATAVIKGNHILSNTAAIGGGLYLQSGDATLHNNVVADNQANGIYIKGGKGQLLHTTIARNASNGVHVANNGADYSTVVLTNTILVSHTTGIIVTDGNTATLEATLWGSGTWANNTEWAGTGIITGTRNYWEDPGFVNPDAGDYHIGANSAARDAGVDAGVNDDGDGDPRPMGHGYDIGADELRVSMELVKKANFRALPSGVLLTYTIHITNTGDVDLHAAVTDTLPAHFTPSGTLTWMSAITAPGGVWTEHVVVTGETLGTFTNVVEATTNEGAQSAYTDTTHVVVTCYLPVIIRGYPPPPCAPYLIAKVETGPESQHVALDVAGRRAFVAHAEGITVIDMDKNVVITTTQPLTMAHSIAYDPDRDRLWIVHRDPNQVVVLDGVTYARLVALPTGDGPHIAAYNPANSRVYVTNYWSGTVSVYDAEALAHVTDLTGFAEPAHIAVNPVTNRIYVANHQSGQGVTAIDGVTHDCQKISNTLLDAYGVTVDATRNLVYVTAIAQSRIAIIDGNKNEQIGDLDIRRGGEEGVWLRAITVNPDVGPEGHLLLVTSSEDGNNGRDQLLLIPNGWPTLGAPVPLDVAKYPQEGIALDPVLDRIWVTSVDSGLVSVVQDGEPVCSTPFARQISEEN